MNPEPNDLKEHVVLSRIVGKLSSQDKLLWSILVSVVAAAMYSGKQMQRLDDIALRLTDSVKVISDHSLALGKHEIRLERVEKWVERREGLPPLEQTDGAANARRY